MRWFCSLILMLMAMVAGHAQRPDFTKMSGMVRQAAMEQMAVARKGRMMAMGMQRKAGTLTAFVRLTTPDATVLTRRGCHVLLQRGALCIAAIPLTELAALSRDSSVERIEAGLRAKAQMDTTRMVTHADRVNEGLGLPHGYTGKGVVVGVQDIGFDLTHPNFWSADGSRYRIKALWDQLSTDTLGSTLPAGRDYRDSLTLLTLGRPRDGDTQTHGTHTAGIAAGSGREADGVGRFAGIASEADICLVCNATSDDAALIDTADYYKYTYALDALGFKYIFDYADSVGKPCVINFSEGSQQDLRGDDQLYYAMLDSLTGPGHILVASAGNDGIWCHYLRKPEGVTAQLDITSPWHRSAMTFTTSAGGNFSLRLLSDGRPLVDIPLDSVLHAADSMLTDTLSLGGTPYYIYAAAYPDCYDPSRVATDWQLSSDRYIYPKRFKLQLVGEADVDLHVTGGDPTNDTAYGGPQATNAYSVLSPGSAPSVLCVGMTGYRKTFVNERDSLISFGPYGVEHGQRNAYSSVGPTFDGRVKPDVMAPGQNIISSWSSYYIANNAGSPNLAPIVRRFTAGGREYAWTAFSGTSMSAPVVTGIIALWLEANPRLTYQDCLDIFARTCTHTGGETTYPNNYEGYGSIDAMAGMQLVIEKATGIRQVASDTNKDNSIFTIGGRYAGKDKHLLPPGMYITKGRKIIIR